MGELQALLTGWLAELAAVLPFGFAFGAGMVAAVNPCGFAMLPAYLSLYLGAHEEDFDKRPSMSRLLRALLVGATVSLRFVLLYDPEATWGGEPPRLISSEYTIYRARQELEKNILPLLE